jgi:UDP-GlcNAc:undecaprenyl-phosphate GlcNAc-1-phosphate transferase
LINSVAMLLPAFVAFSTTIAALILLKPLAIRLGLIDVPGGRKHHQGNVPLIGGIGMFLGLGFSLLTLNVSLSHHRCLIACSALLVITGMLDDFRELTPRSRLFIQILVGLLMAWWGNVNLQTFGYLIPQVAIHLSFLSVPVTVLAVVVLINAVNMTDGADGLAGSLGVIEFFYLVWLSYRGNLIVDQQILYLIITMLIAFLWFNFPWRQSANVFMGDSGSMMIGFLLAWFCIDLSQPPHAVARPVTFLWIMAVPLWDISSVVLRRVIKGFSPFRPDRGHLHHYLLQRQFSSLQVTIIISFIAMMTGFVAIIGEYLNVPEYILFLSFLMTFIIYILVLRHAWKRLDM